MARVTMELTLTLLTPSARRLLPTVIPAIVVGVASALLLVGLSAVAAWLEHLLWTTIPDALGVAGDSGIWIFLMLTLAGLVIGLVVTVVPGHAGPDPATVGLAEPPMPLGVLPGLAIVLVLMLASGVSLGPENPIMAIAIGLSVVVGGRILPRLPAPAWAAFGFSGMIGAMFGTPVAAALLISEQPSDAPMPLWDRLFGPLLASAAGTITVLLLSGDSFRLDLAPYDAIQALDLVTGMAVAVGAAILGLAAVELFPVVYGSFKRLGPPLVMLVAGGVVLGLLGAIGGPITLFKGLSQMQELADTAGTYSALTLLSFAIIKLVALLVAGTSGFRGGRIFPAVFVAVAFGLAVNAGIPQIPQAVAVGASLIGILLAVTRSGWLALFMAALMVGDPNAIPLFLVILLPAWLVVTGRREMVIPKPAPSATA